MADTIKMNKQIVICENCGAEYGIHEPQCTFCGHINPIGAEEQYMEQMQNIKSKLAEVDDEQVDVIKTEIKKNSKVVLKVLLVVGIIVLVIAAYYVFLNFKTSSQTMSSTEKAAWLQEYEPELERMYDEQDFDGLMDLYDSLLVDDNLGAFYSWKHGNLIAQIANIRFFTRYVNEGNARDSDWEYLLFQAAYYYKGEYRNGTYSAKDIVYLDEYASGLIELVYDKLDIDENTLEDISKTCVTETGYLHTTKVSDYYKENIKK